MATLSPGSGETAPMASYCTAHPYTHSHLVWGGRGFSVVRHGRPVSLQVTAHRTEASTSLLRPPASSQRMMNELSRGRGKRQGQVSPRVPDKSGLGMRNQRKLHENQPAGDHSQPARGDERPELIKESEWTSHWEPGGRSRGYGPRTPASGREQKWHQMKHEGTWKCLALISPPFGPLL